MLNYQRVNPNVSKKFVIYTIIMRYFWRYFEMITYNDWYSSGGVEARNPTRAVTTVGQDHLVYIWTPGTWVRSHHFGSFQGMYVHTYIYNYYIYIYIHYIYIYMYYIYTLYILYIYIYTIIYIYIYVCNPIDTLNGKLPLEPQVTALFTCLVHPNCTEGTTTVKDPWKCPTERGDFHQETWGFTGNYRWFMIFMIVILAFCWDFIHLYTCVYQQRCLFFSRGLYMSINVFFFGVGWGYI